jgi:hypothetical protein
MSEPVNSPALKLAQLRTRSVEEAEEIGKLMDELMTEHRAGKVSALLFAYYGPTGRLSYTISDSMGIEQLAWAVSMLQARLTDSNLRMRDRASDPPPDPAA